MEKTAFDYPLTAGKCRVCIEEGQYRAYLDCDAALELLFSLHWFAQQNTAGEEISVSTRNDSELPRKGKTIGLCEFNLTLNHTQKKQGKTILKQARQVVRNKSHGVYTEEQDRLDYFVSPGEVQAACEILAAFLANTNDRRQIHEVTLFGTFVVRLVAS